MDEARSALIIASYQYDDERLRRLRAPASDARALADVLVDPGIGGFEVRTLLNEPAHVVNLAVEEFFSDRRPGDLLLVHFSGHGIKDQDGELYFAASNTVLGLLGATAVAAEFVSRRISRSRSRRVVLLLDCCYAGAFERSLLTRAGAEVGIEQHFGGRGRAVITASSAMEYAFEAGELTGTDEVPPSLFTSALVQGLKTGDADRDQDGLVGLDELYDYIYDKVRAAAPSQTPGKWAFGMEGELYIARRARPVSTPAPLPPELRRAIDSPLAGVRAGAVQELAAVLRGSHAGMALAAGLALEQLVGDDSRVVAAAAAAALVTPALVTPAPVPPAGPQANATTRREPAPEAPVAAEPDQHPDPTRTMASNTKGHAIPPATEAPPRDNRSPAAASQPSSGGKTPRRRRPRRVGRRRVIIVSSAAGIAVIGLVVATIVIHGKPAPSLLRWTYATGGQVWSSPAVADGIVYVGSNDHNVYALEAATGKLVWKYATGDPVVSSPAVADGIVYIGSEDGKVYALEAATGKLVWKYATGGQVWSSPAVAGGIVYFGSNDGNVCALDASSHQLVWKYATRGPVRSSPAVAGGIVYIASDDGNVYALRAARTATNRLFWHYHTQGWVVSSPVLADGTVYVGSHDYHLYALAALTGGYLWDYAAEEKVDSRPVVADGVVYVGSDDRYVYALDAVTHQLRWAKNIGGFVVSGPAVAGNTVYVGSGDNHVYALNAANGDQQWAYTTGSPIFSSPVVAGGVVYVGSEDGKVYALNAVP